MEGHEEAAKKEQKEIERCSEMHEKVESRIKEGAGISSMHKQKETGRSKKKSHKEALIASKMQAAKAAGRNEEKREDLKSLTKQNAAERSSKYGMMCTETRTSNRKHKDPGRSSNNKKGGQEKKEAKQEDEEYIGKQ